MGSTVFERYPTSENLITQSLRGSMLAPFWTQDAPRANALPQLSGEHAADLVVVGGGYAGLWTALLAKERDSSTRVILLEGKLCGHAASGRNGGFVESTLTHGESNGRSRYPREYDDLDRLGMQNLDEIEQTVKQRGWKVDFERNGSFAIATEEYQARELAHEADGERTIFLDQDEIRSRIHSPTFMAALHEPRETALVHPAKLVNELVSACLNAGVEIFEQSPVRSLDAEPDQIVVRATSGRVVAERVALATNAYPSLLKRFQLHTVPVYDYVLMTEPLSDAQRKSIGWSGREGLADTANQFHYYRLSADNRILFGGYDAIYHYGGKVRERYENRTESFRKLASHFFTTFPQLEGIRFTHRWAGVIDTCSRFSAFFATAHNSRVAYAAGFTGLGVAATRFAANVMLDQLQHLSTERTNLRMTNTLPMPFPPEPLAFAAIQVTRAAIDRADHNSGQRGLLLKTMDAMGLGFDS